MSRTKKIKPIFNQIEKTNGINEWVLSNDKNFLFFQNEFEWGAENSLIMSPYSNFIPLIYLFNVKENLYFNWLHHQKDCKKNLPRMFNFSKLSIKESIQKIHTTLIQDDPVAIELILARSMYVGKNFNDDFERTFCRLKQRSFSTLTGMYSLFLKPVNRWTVAQIDRIPEVYSPHVLAVILPENYLYMKYKFLLEGVIDLSKVIILVDRDLNTPQFYKQPVRKLYKEMILPKIMETSCQIWEVPKEFILENCFIKDFDIKTFPVRERKTVTKELIQKFKESINHETKSEEEFEKLLTRGSFLNPLAEYTLNYYATTTEPTIYAEDGVASF